MSARAKISTFQRHGSQRHGSAHSLVLVSLIACLAMGACRLFTHALSFDAAELDGIAFLAALYWALSVIGYFVPRAAKTPASSASNARRANVAEQRTGLKSSTRTELVA